MKKFCYRKTMAALAVLIIFAVGFWVCRPLFSGEKQERFGDVGDPVFSPYGKQFAYKAFEGGRWFIVIGDKKGERFNDVGDPVFSPDGKKVAYKAFEGSKWFIVIE